MIYKRIKGSRQIGNYLAGHVPPNRKLFGGTVPPYRKLFGGTVSLNRKFLGRTASPNNFPLSFKLFFTLWCKCGVLRYFQTLYFCKRAGVMGIHEVTREKSMRKNLIEKLIR